MKKNSLFIFLPFLFCVLLCKAQTNLVPNPSFEDFTTCPFNEGQFADGWYSCGVSPDYFNSCNITNYGVPKNYAGYQKASTGDGYAGIIAYDKVVPHTDKEYIGRDLAQSLVVGQKYFVSFKVSLPKKDTSITNPSDGGVFACNKLGVLFTNTSYDEFNPPPENNFAHVWSNQIITDTLNWRKITGSFVATTTYSKIVLGVFFENNQVDTLRLFKPNVDVFAYYYIDDICVSTDSLLCNMPVGIKELETESNQFNIYPNPALDYFTINNKLLSEKYTLTIYNTLGQKLFEEKHISTKNKKIDISAIEEGLLHISINSNNQHYNFKLVKN